MLNHIDLMGRLTRDPERRYLEDGTPTASFSLAVEMKYIRKLIIIIGVCGFILAYGTIGAADHDAISFMQAWYQLAAGFAMMGGAILAYLLLEAIENAKRKKQSSSNPN